MTIERLIEDAKALLAENQVLLQKIKPELYLLPSAYDPDSGTVGEHIRHSINTYQSINRAFKEKFDFINYDEKYYDQFKEHNKLLQESPVQAIRDMEDIKRRVEHLKDIPVQIVNNNESMNSNYCRELEYANDHLVHHDATIKSILKSYNQKISRQFGVSPSTLRFTDKFK